MVKDECENKHSGFIRWWQLASLCLATITITLTIVLAEVSAMMKIDENSRSRDISITDIVSTMRSEISTTRSDISWIKAKLERM